MGGKKEASKVTPTFALLPTHQVSKMTDRLGMRRDQEMSSNGHCTRQSHLRGRLRVRVGVVEHVQMGHFKTHGL